MKKKKEKYPKCEKCSHAKYYTKRYGWRCMCK